MINELGYASSLAAKSMRSRKTNVIDLVVPDLKPAFCLNVVKGVNLIRAFARLLADDILNF